MLIEILGAMLLGVLAGTITGLIPGIHINLIGTLLIAFSLSVLRIIPETYILVFIVSMAITHTFVDFIPSVFLGCPDTDTELSILPGHQMLKEGEGYQAIILTCYGSLIAIFMIIFLTVPSILILPKIEPILPKIIPGLLIISSLSLISLEKRKIQATTIFTLSGILGFFALNFSTLQEPLLPLLSGLFGGSMLITSIKNKTKIPKQKITLPKTNLFKPILGSTIASPICSFLPGLGSGQAAIIGNTIVKTDQKGFLVLIGATNTLVMGFSFITLYILSKTRTGATVAIKEILGNLTIQNLILILFTSLVVGIISFFLTKNLAKICSKNIEKINYTFLSTITLILLIAIVQITSGFKGIAIFSISTILGIVCIKSKVKRTNMMGCLLIPTIILYLI